MNITEFFPEIKRPIEIKGISSDSREIKAGYIFVAIPGLTVDGHKFINNAVKDGAVVVVGEQEVNSKGKFEYIRVKNARKTFSELAAKWYGNPAKKLKIVGITGTDGKTTTANMLYSMLTSVGKKAAVISTVGAIINGKEIDTGLHVSSPEPLDLHKYLKMAVESETEYAIIEVTSHALDQERVYGIEFEASVVTNITHEHLDYHKTYNNYLNTKAKLIAQSKAFYVNKDDNSYELLIKKSPKVIPYSTKKIKLEKDVKEHLDKYFPGEYNKANYASARVLAKHLGLSSKEINDGVIKLTKVEGRYGQYITKDNKNVVIDFAHTPNGLDCFLSALKEKHTDVTVLFGAEGHRDIKKRPLMGSIAAKHCKYIVLTSIDPRTENPKEIITQIRKGIPKSFPKENIFEIVDREEAIEFSIRQLLDMCNVVATAGKGHEVSMTIGKTDYPWSEEEVVKKAIDLRNSDVEFIKNLKVSKDTRTINKGDYYIPVDGTNYGGKFDGHNFIAEAKKKGAAGILEEEELYYYAKKKLNLINPKVIGITGSMGKTTVKEVVATVLEEDYTVLKSPGNLNTVLGLSITIINELNNSHEIFVAEMGMDKAGEIEKTCKIIQPDISLITVINGVHLESLKSIQNIIKAKGEILHGTKPTGIGILNKDNKNSLKLKNAGKCKKAYFSGKDLKFNIKNTNLLGEHSKTTAAAAIKIAEIVGLNAVQIKRGLKKAQHPKGRLRLLQGKNGAILIDDSYNANPDSTIAALQVLHNTSGKRKYAILGDMLELGANEEDGHKKVLKFANTLKLELLLTVGPRMIKALDNVLLPQTNTVATLNYEDAITYINSTLKLGEKDVVLIKGSQGIRTENITEVLIKDPTEAPELLVRQDSSWKK